MQSHARDNLQDFALIIAMPEPRTARTGCYDVDGCNCFAMKPGAARCLKNCTPGKTQPSTQPQGILDPILQDAVPVRQTLHGFSVYTKGTGSTKPCHELDILKHQHQQPLASFIATPPTF